MRPHRVEVAPPLLDPDLGVDAIPKPLQRDELVAELAVERFVGAILPRLAWIDQRRLDASVLQPPQDRAGHKLRTVVPSKHEVKAGQVLL